MSGSIKIDPEVIKAAVADLRALGVSTALDDAQQALLSASPAQSSGGTASVAKALGDGFSAVNRSMKRLFELTALMLQGIDGSFAKTEEEITVFIKSTVERR